MSSTDEPTRRCVVVDVGDGSLLADVTRVEDLLMTLRRWADEAAGPHGDGWAPPRVLAGDGPVHLLGRLYRVLRPTQTRTEYSPSIGQRREVRPDGPRWFTTADVEVAAVSFVNVAARDVDLLSAIAAELGHPGGDPDVRDAIDEHDRNLAPTSDTRRRERGVVVTATRIAGLLDLETTDDTQLLDAALTGAAEADRVVLSTKQEVAHHRTIERLAAFVGLSDPLTRRALAPRS